MSWLVTTILPLVVAALISLQMAYVIWQRRPSPGALPLAGMMLAAGYWALLYAVELMVEGVDLKILIAKFEYIGIVAIPVFWLFFAVDYTYGSEPVLPRRARALLFVFPLVILGLVFTNELHLTIWDRIQIRQFENFTILQYSHGDWFWAFSAYSYLLLGIGSFLILRNVFGSARPYWTQGLTLLLGVVISWGANAIYLLNLSPYPALDVTPFGFILSGLAIAWSIFRGGLLELVPVAQAMVLESMSDAVIVLNLAGRIADANTIAARLAGKPAWQMIGVSLAEAYQGNTELIIGLGGVLSGQAEQVITDIQTNDRYEVQVLPIEGRRGQSKGQILLLRNVTEKLKAESALRESEEKNRSLLASIRAPVVALNNRLEVQYINRAYAEWMGLPAEQAVGQGFKTLFPKFLETRTFRAYENCLRSREIQEIGEWFGDTYFQTRVFPTPTGLLAVSDDITRQKQTEQKLVVSNDRLEGLRQIDQAILSAKSPAEIALVAMEHIRVFVPFMHGIVGLIDFENRELVLLAEYKDTYDEREAGTRLVFDPAELPTRLRRGEPIYIPDMQHDPLAPRLCKLLCGADAGACTLLPLMAPDGLIGFVVLAMKTAYGFTVEHLSVAREVSDSLAIAVQNARLLDEISKNLDREAKLNRLTRILNSTMDMNKLLDDLLSQATNLVGAEAAVLSLLEENGARLSMPHAYKFPNPVRGQIMPKGEGIAWQIVETGESVLLSEYREHPMARPQWVEAGVHAFIGVPVIAGGAPLGALGLYCFDPDRRFTQVDVALAENVGLQAGLVIQNAQLVLRLGGSHAAGAGGSAERRGEFFTSLEREFFRSRRYERQLSVLVLEPGPPELVQEHRQPVIQSLQQALRRSDIVSPYGSQAVAILLTETDRNGALTVASRLLGVLNQMEVLTVGRDGLAESKIGVTTLNGHCRAAQDLFDQAEAALEQVRSRPGEQVTVWQAPG
jgi:PAS domain S-box-containing protein